MASRMAEPDERTARCIGCGYEGRIAEFEQGELPVDYRMRARRAQVEPLPEGGVCPRCEGPAGDDPNNDYLCGQCLDDDANQQDWSDELSRRDERERGGRSKRAWGENCECGHMRDQHQDRTRQPGQSCLVTGCGCGGWTKAAQLEPGMAECKSCHWFGPRDEFVDFDGEPGCPDCGSASVKFAMVRTAGTFDGSTPCSSCGSTPPAGDWKGSQGECEACAERRDGSRQAQAMCSGCGHSVRSHTVPIPPDDWMDVPCREDGCACEEYIEQGRQGQSLTVPSVPSAKPAEDSGEKKGNGDECDVCGQPAPGQLRPVTRDFHELPGGPGAAINEFVCPACFATEPMTDSEMSTYEEKVARDPEEDERGEMPPACAMCGTRDPDWYEAPGVGMVCSRCIDGLVDQQERDADYIEERDDEPEWVEEDDHFVQYPLDDEERDAAGTSHDLLRSLTET